MIRTVSETGSTNADLVASLRSSVRLAEGFWLVTDRQTKGRGRQGREWFDGTGNFMGSTVVHLRPSDPPPASLALVVGLALYETILPLLPEPTLLGLKWPNDLMVGGAKAAGILLEREGDALVVGVGVNLAHAPSVEGRNTIALSQISPTPARDDFASALASNLSVELDRWRQYGLEPLIRRWLSVAHAVGTPLSVTPPGEAPIFGTFGGLTEDGALQLILAKGGCRVIHAGDVFFLPREG